MKKICESCGKEFEARESFYKLCPNCHTSPKRDTNLSQELILTSYYDQNGNFRREVFIDVPEKLAHIFARANPALAATQLRDFLQIVLNARTRALLRSIDVARPILYKCQANLEYQLKRGKIPSVFVQFMKAHLAQAEKDEKSLDGFYQHLDSIVCYFPTK